MSKRIIVMDHSIMDQVNMGNAEVARLWVQLSRTQGVEIWTPRENYQMRKEVDQVAMDKLETNVPLQMSDHYLKKHQRAIDDAKIAAGTPRATAALALHLKLERGGASVEIMSVDRRVANPAASGGYKVIAPLTRVMINVQTVAFDKGQVDYNRARRLLGLGPVHINAGSGKIITPPKPPPTMVVNGKPVPVSSISGMPTLTINGQPRRDLSSEAKSNRPGVDRTVQVPKGGHTAGPPANQDRKDTQGRPGKVAGVELGLRGLHGIIHWINDAEQKARFDADWKPKKRAIEEKLAANPGLGALIFAYYSQRQKTAQERDSGEQFVRQFLYISYEFGHSDHEAWLNFQRRPDELNGVGAGAVKSELVGWIPPKSPVDPGKLPTPFPAEALATFVAGRPWFTDVKWRGIAGFDDAGETKLDLGNRLAPHFVVMSVPEQITFFNGQLRHTADIDLTGEYPAETDVIMVMPLTSVELDSVFGNTSAVMVYPADEYSTHVFGRTPKIKGVNGQLAYRGLEHVRFVEPENIRVLRDFRLEKQGK